MQAMQVLQQQGRVVVEHGPLCVSQQLVGHRRVDGSHTAQDMAQEVGLEALRAVNRHGAIQAYHMDGLVHSLPAPGRLAPYSLVLWYTEDG